MDAIYRRRELLCPVSIETAYVPTTLKTVVNLISHISSAIRLMEPKKILPLLSITWQLVHFILFRIFRRVVVVFD